MQKYVFPIHFPSVVQLLVSVTVSIPLISVFSKKMNVRQKFKLSSRSINVAVKLAYIYTVPDIGFRGPGAVVVRGDPMLTAFVV